MTQINIIGQILDSSGYSVHTRNLANALSKIADVRLSTMIPSGAETLLSDKEIEMIKKPDKEEINIIITSPVHWKMHTNAKRNWAYLVWEGDRVPKSFITECLNPDIEYILVPSAHTENAILKSIGLTQETKNTESFCNKIKIIPHGVNLDLFYPKNKPEKFTFITNKGWRHLEDRGGMQYVVKAYLEEFSAIDNVNLIIKINPAYGIPNVQALLKELTPKDKKDLPLMQLNSDNMPYKNLVNFYNLGKVFVMPTRSESFGIPGIEAMACGLPVIATDFGGQVDYCNEKSSWLVGGELIEVTWELMYEGTKWLTPDIDELRKAMRYCYDNLEEVKKKGLEALNTAKNNTWDHSAEKIISLV